MNYSVFYKKPLKDILCIIINIFNHEEQKEIINKFLNVVDMKTIIKDKVSICKSCKFNQQNMCLYKLNIPINIITNICKYCYEECGQRKETSKYITLLN